MLKSGKYKMNKFKRFPNEKVLIVMALREESGGVLENNGFSVKYSGLGMVNAASRLTEFLMTEKPDRVINLGTAGSMSIPMGELVEVEYLVQRGHVVSFIRQRKKLSTITHFNKVTCGTADFVEVEKSANTLYQVMDMEALAFAQVCEAAKIPFHSIKYVTDSSDLNTLDDWKRNIVNAQTAFLKFCQSLNN
jgi:adenosylhomocysteine nucleosidase